MNRWSGRHRSWRCARDYPPVTYKIGNGELSRRLWDEEVTVAIGGRRGGCGRVTCGRDGSLHFDPVDKSDHLFLTGRIVKNGEDTDCFPEAADNGQKPCGFADLRFDLGPARDRRPSIALLLVG